MAIGSLSPRSTAHIALYKHRPSVLALAFIGCLTLFGARDLSAIVLAPAPQVRFETSPPDVPPEVLIGEDFTFQVRFRNVPSLATIPGYGVFIDLLFDEGGANITKPPQTPSCACDGMTFLQAEMIGINGGPVPLTSHLSQSPCDPSTTRSHPFAGVLPVLVPKGSRLVTLELPFGSFDPSQPEIVVRVKAHVSSFADPGYALKIRARGGFRYGATPTVDAPPDWPVLSDLVFGTPPFDQQTNSLLWAAQAQTQPTVLTVSKTYIGPEDETATGPNFPRRYSIALDVANGQTINNLKVTDRLANTVAFHQMVPVSASSPCTLAVTTSPVPNVAHNAPLNDLVLQCSSITGLAGPDATIVFEFFIPDVDGSGNPILPTCNFVQSVNDVKAEGDWTPIDPCDSGTFHVVSDVTAADHTLIDKCLAIQKTVTDVSGGPPSHPIPGDTLQYTLRFQLSDFKTAGNLKIRDILSDGQTLLSPLTLSVTDQCGTTSGTIPANALSQITLPCTAGGAPPPRTELDIDVSKAIMILSTTGGPLRHQGGVLTGGYAFAPGSTSTVPATGTIVFQTKIDDAYQCPVGATHDLFVDKDDPLDNAVTMTADILANGGACSTTPGPTGVTSQDGSQAAVVIATDFLVKSVFAVQRGSAQVCGPTSTPCPAAPDVRPGDFVVFRLTKTIWSGDAENLTIQDWLPLPIFLAAGGGISNVQCGTPSVGNACLGPLNTLSTAPAYTADAVTNSIKFNYGTFNNPGNQPRTIDLLFTRAVTNTPFADGLFLTNEAQECESNTFGVTICQAAIAQVHVREPALRITKGTVASTNPNAVFSPGQVGPVAFQGVGTSCPRFSGTINSTNLAAAPINSDVSNVDANDCVTFAIVVENMGGSPAYDVQLRESFPPGPVDIPDCFVPDFNTVCITDGTGAPIPFTTGIAFHASLPISLQAPLPGAGGTPGSNIAVITFDACVVADIKPQCCVDYASVENYASTPGGPSYTGAGFDGPLQDSAQLCVIPKATKGIKTTSEAHTPGTPSGPPLSPEQLAVGEIIRYHLEVVVPESTATANYTLRDFLPAGLSYMPGATTVATTIGSPITIGNFPPLVTGATLTCNGGNINFDFGNVTNTNSNAAQEIIVLEFNALVCNVASNQNGTPLNNSFAVLVDGQQVSGSNTVQAVVVEPNITITKAGAVLTPLLLPTATATYTVTLTNTGTATAFDVQLTDQLPGCLTNLTNVQINASTGVTGVTNTSTSSALNVAIAVLPVNGTVIIHYSATVTCIDCNQLINTATVRWTSLPGPQGTTSNLTNSPTPGASGSANGERNGAGGVLNDYIASATANLCCMIVSNETIACDPSGTFTYTFTVTNTSNLTVFSVNLSPVSPANVTFTPAFIIIPLLAPGASTSVTVTIGGAGAVSGANICFKVQTGSTIPICVIDRCLTLPTCGCVQPPTGMVAWYPLDETQGATAVNDIAPPPASSVNNVGTSLPAAVGAASSPIPVAGQVHGALYFAGGYVEVPPQSDLDLGGGSFSIDAWVREVQCVPNFLSPIADKLNTGTNAGFAFYLDQPTPGTGLIRLRLNGSTFTSSGSIAAISSPITNTGPWFHVAVTFDASSGAGTFYINGSPAGTFTSSAGPLNNTLPMWIGRTRVSGGLCEIAVDELEIFNRSLTLAELKAIYNAGPAGKCTSGQACLTSFEDRNGNGAQDPGESLLAGWRFSVTDEKGALAGTIISGGTSPSCLTLLRPGKYTITEQIQEGWKPTTPNPQTVTVSAGQKVTVTAGNQSTRKRRRARF